MCVECASCLQVFSRFGPGCVIAGEGTLPLSDPQKDIKLEPVEIEAASNPQSLMETEIKCSFCTEAYGREDVVSLNDSNENKLIVNVLEQYISETNLKNTEELLACGSCLEALEGVLGVIVKCLKVEKKIREYIELEGTDNKGQIHLKEVQKLMLRPKVKLEMDNLERSCDEIKEKYTTMAELEIKYETEISQPELIIKTEDDIKSEHSDFDVAVTKSEKSDCDESHEPFIENKIPDDLSLIPVVTSETRKRKKRIKHLLTHKISSKTKTFHCEICSYDTKNKNFWNKHLLNHKSPSELKMFKCELCSYETKLKGNLKKHLLIHRSPSELKMFKCELCSYETKLKGNLKKHLLIHRSPSEGKMFNCEYCSFETKYKCSFQKHLLIHRSPSERKMFNCEYCSFETKYKNSFQTHLLTHKSPSELKMFKCKLCSYEAKHKGSLRQHLLTHKSPSDLKMFKCELCSYETKRKGDLKKHLLIHKSPAELKMFKCEYCSFVTKYKYSFQKHLFDHRIPSELKRFKFRLSTYGANRKNHPNGYGCLKLPSD